MVLKQAEIRLLDKGDAVSGGEGKIQKKARRFLLAFLCCCIVPFQGAAPLPEPALDYSPIVSGATISWVRIST